MIIFLDFDGVLNNSEDFCDMRRRDKYNYLPSLKSEHKEWFEKQKDCNKSLIKSFARNMNKGNVKAFKEFISVLKKHNLNPRIVISSSWRGGFTPENWDFLFKKILNIKCNVIGCTPKLLYTATPNLDSAKGILTIEEILASEFCRGHEIAAWMYNHDNSEPYIILDDDDDMLKGQSFYFIRTNAKYGLTRRNVLILERMCREKRFIVERRKNGRNRKFSQTARIRCTLKKRFKIGLPR